MKLSKLFPKEKMDEIFSRHGFEKQQSGNGFIYVNKFNNFVSINRHRFKKNTIIMDCSAISLYAIQIDKLKREWNDDESQELISFLEKIMLPQISNLKGPYNIKLDYYFEKIGEIFSKYIESKGERGNKDIRIPFGNDEVDYNFNYLHFNINEDTTVLFLNNGNIYEVLITIKNTKKLYKWYDFAEKNKEGDELIEQLVENLATFLKLKE